MSLKEQLQADLTASMKARDELTTATLRMVLTALTDEEKSGRTERVLTDAEVVTILGREAKKRREAAEAFRAGGREDRAERELAEGSVLDRYLPAQLPDDELAELVAAAVEEAGAASPRDMGKVMGLLGPRTAGRAEGARVAAAVRAALGS